MESAFEGAISFDQPIGSWNVSRVRTLKNMFGYGFASTYSRFYSIFNQDISKWDVSRVVVRMNTIGIFKRIFCTYLQLLVFAGYGWFV